MSFDIADAIIKFAAVAGISYVWANFTLRAFKMARHIVFYSPENLPEIISFFRCEYCGKNFRGNIHSERWCSCQPFYVCDDCAKKEVLCEKCQERFLDDREELRLDKIL